MKEEQSRRIEELSKLSKEEIERRVTISNKLLSVQKELLASRKPTKVISHTHSTVKVHAWPHSLMTTCPSCTCTLVNPTQPITPRPISYTEEVLDDLKFYMQEQLLRKAHQRDAIAAMEEEKKRRMAECPNSPVQGVSDEQARVLEEVQRKV